MDKCWKELWYQYLYKTNDLVIGMDNTVMNVYVGNVCFCVLPLWELTPLTFSFTIPSNETDVSTYLFRRQTLETSHKKLLIPLVLRRELKYSNTPWTISLVINNIFVKSEWSYWILSQIWGSQTEIWSHGPFYIYYTTNDVFFLLSLVTLPLMSYLPKSSLHTKKDIVLRIKIIKSFYSCNTL